MELNVKLQGKLKEVIKLARAASLMSDVKEFKLGAVIFDKHRIYTYAANTTKANPMQKYYNKWKSKSCSLWHNHSAHAEINCIHKLLQQYYGKLPEISKLSILIYREHYDGTFALAKPCKACTAALKKFGFRHIYYTGESSLIYEEFIV